MSTVTDLDNRINFETKRSAFICGTNQHKSAGNLKQLSIIFSNNHLIFGIANNKSLFLLGFKKA